MINFNYPIVLHGLWLLPVILMLWWWQNKKKQERLQRFIRWPLVNDLVAHNRKPIKIISQWLLLLAFALTILSLAAPERAVKGHRAVTLGLDILFLVDTSKSMDATDIYPTRLKRAQQALIYLVDQLEGHRMGVIQFAGEAFVSCPFTQDKSALKLIIDSLQTDNLPTRGTDLAAAYRLAMETFARNGAKHKVAVLVSDGENFGAKPFRLARQGKRKGIRLYCLGTGTPAGAGLVNNQEVMLDHQDNPVISKLKPKDLQLLADSGGGRYWPLTVRGYQEEELILELNRLEKVKRFTTGYHNWQPLYPWLALVAALALMLSLVISPRKKWKSMITSGGLLCLLCLPHPAGAESYRQLMQEGLEAFNNQDIIRAEQLMNRARQKKTGHALGEYNFGCVLLMQKKLLPAYRAFKRAKETAGSGMLQDVLYNLGYVAFYLGIQEGTADYWKEALEAYKTLLMNYPQDDDARYNIEIILREIKKRTKTAVPEQEESQGNSKGKDPGGGADKPGDQQAQSKGRKNSKAPPRQEQEETQKRKNQGKQPKTSDDSQGNRQKGMSQQEALRTLKSLEAEESSMQQHWQNKKGETPNYQGPVW